MGKVVIPKHTADLSEIIAALKIYYEANGAWVTNTEHTQQLKGLIGADQYPSSYPKKAQFLTYYGFTEWNPVVDSERRITKRGKAFYEAYIGDDKEGIWATIADALEDMTFGRNNNGVGSSDSDIEPPCLLVRAILDLDYIVNREYSFLLWRLAEGGGNYNDVKEEIRSKRKLGLLDYPEECKQPAYSDLKIIVFFVRLEFLLESTSPDGKKCIVLNPAVKEKYGNRFANLKIYNVDKITPDAQNEDTFLMIENLEQTKEYTIDELGAILAEMYNKATTKSTAFHMFGIKYGSVIKKQGFTAVALITAAKLNDSYRAEVSKGLCLYDSLSANEFGVKFCAGKDRAEMRALDDPNRVKGGVNVLLYGVPGCGKSHEIRTKYCSDKKYMERVVFHPDYTYSDFVGQILPKTDGTTISYPFTEGPFTTILRKAIYDPEHMYYLVIEEINRGNAPAIFGEVFQLLDREDGTSEYGINNFDIAKCVYGIGKEEDEIKIPSNLTILATMNTADQNVFTLDTAFKRRWNMRNIENNIAACKHANNQICGTTVTWGFFATRINNLIIDIGEGNLSSEDNRLGAYFVKAADLPDERAFAEKILMYLWNDAFKYDRDKVFNPEYRTLEELLKGFYAVKFDVFLPHLGFDNIVSAMPATSTPSESEYLEGKNQDMINLYTSLRDNVLSACPDLEVGSTSSKSYLTFYAANHGKKSFANLHITSNRIRVFTKEPRDTALRSLGQNITGNYNYHFEISVDDDSDLRPVTEAIIDSYHQCI